MKFVSLVVAAMIISFGADAQTTRGAAEKSAVAHKQQKPKGGKVKPSRKKSTTAATNEVITLTDEKAHKAKWTFEEMLKRRLEIDAEEGVTQQ
jgi:hypothetical protein